MWNVRGCNKPFKQKEIKLFLSKTKIDICALVETRVKIKNFKKVQQKNFRGWESLHNYNNAYNGRVWVCWNPRKVVVVPIVSHAQGIHCRVTDLLDGKVFDWVAVYGYNSVEQRTDLWRLLSEVAGGVNGPLLVGGDFNSVLTTEDRIQGNPVSAGEIRDMAECISVSRLTEVRTIGGFFTWCNKQE